MIKELIIHSTPNGVDIALLENKQLVELHQERNNNRFNVGDVYLGKIKKVMPGLNAAFVDVGHEKDAFLHYTDLSPDIRSLMKFTGQCVAGNVSPEQMLNNFEMQPEIVKTGNVKEVLSNKHFLLVQILKEPISTKGPRLTCEVSIAGRFLVLTPFNNTVGVSKKIDSADERKRLKNLVESLKPKNFGVIVRTVAAGKGAAELHQDLLALQEKWQTMMRNLRHAQPVTKVLSEVDKTQSILRDLLSPQFNRIVTDDPAIARDVEEYLKRVAPDKKDIVNRYNGKVPIFDQFGITRQIKSSFGKTVTMPNGSYLILEKTEALHVIDVNSGHRSTMEGDQESNALKVNLEAAEEVGRQLRLRDLGGIIVVDFIDMKNPDNKRLVHQKMKDVMELDRATHTILPLSKFNIMQITRERVRPEINISTTEACPTCSGTGQINASLLLIDEMVNDLEHLLNTHTKLKLYCHPIIAAYLRKGFPSLRMRWFLKYKKWIAIHPNEDFGITEYKFFDDNDEEIKID
ncbi:MAG: Rne/Rng family ribonuclease [Chitinophagales bacterium]|nr:Rne/Rng family ribonuclease [Chitinophagales bacterium]